MWKYTAERSMEDARSAVFCLGDLSAKVGQTQFVSWQDWGDFLNSSNSIYKSRETCSDA